MRKVIVFLLVLTYIMGSGIIPPLMDLWNKEGYVGPLPWFFAGLYIISGALVLLVLILYLLERNDNTFDE